MTYGERYLNGIALFNQTRFFEAHEVWESLWRATEGPEKAFLQGLIQVASALYQWQTGNLRGARLLHDSGLALLRPYGRAYWGLDLDRVGRLTTAALKEVAEAPWENLPGRLYEAPLRVPYDARRLFKISVGD